MSTCEEDSWAYLLVINNTLIHSPTWSLEAHGYQGSQIHHVNSFNELYNVVPTYIFSPGCEYGRYDEVYGNWSGMLGHVG